MTEKENTDFSVLFSMAEQGRFELPQGYKPSDGFQDRSLQPLEYCSKTTLKYYNVSYWEYGMKKPPVSEW